MPVFRVEIRWGFVILSFMKILISLLSCFLLVLSGCTAFENNLEESKNAGSVQSLNEKETEQIEELSSGGQLNQDEEEEMNQSISESGNSGY